jgi:hypothetical protein
MISVVNNAHISISNLVKSAKHSRSIVENNHLFFCATFQYRSIVSVINVLYNVFAKTAPLML